MAHSSHTLRAVLEPEVRRDQILQATLTVDSLQGFRGIVESAGALNESHRAEVLTAIGSRLRSLPTSERRTAINEFLQVAQTVTQPSAELEAWMQAATERRLSKRGREVRKLALSEVRAGELPQSVAFKYGVDRERMEKEAAKNFARRKIQNGENVQEVCSSHGITSSNVIRDLVSRLADNPNVYAALRNGETVPEIARQYGVPDEFKPVLEMTAAKSGRAFNDVMEGRSVQTVCERYGIQSEGAIRELESWAVVSPPVLRALEGGADVREVAQRHGIVIQEHIEALEKTAIIGGPASSEVLRGEDAESVAKKYGITTNVGKRTLLAYEHQWFRDRHRNEDGGSGS
jgi:transposase-like protein